MAFVRHLVSYCIIGFVLFSCAREEAWDCVQAAGERTIVDVPFDTTILNIKLYDDVSLVLHPGTVQRFELHTRETIVPSVQFRLDSGFLHIHNQIKCRWARESKNVEVHLYTPVLRRVENWGYGDIRSADTLHFPFNVLIYIPTTIDLKMNAPALGMELYQLADVKLAGRVGSLDIYINDGRDAIVDAKSLHVTTANIAHAGYNDIHLNVSDKIRTYIWGSGNILLYQRPTEIVEVEHTGTGKIIVVGE
ncbi:MAG: DUF2807 domain-containing protein [Cyclobacteriaceae bacterium]|nr:DUF2807 domain-containing protein [Cyclobacteriaceae bacterium]